MESPLGTKTHTETNSGKSPVCQLEEVLAYGSSYIGSRIDGLKLFTREHYIHAISILVMSYMRTMLVLIACTFLILGVAMGIGTMLGGHTWLGFVLTGGGLVIGEIFYKNYQIKKNKRVEMKSIIEVYESELAMQRKKYGRDMRSHSKPNNGPFVNESEFINWKTSVAKMAFVQSGMKIKKDILHTVDVVRLTEEYPLYSTGIAAAAGFIVAANFGSDHKKMVSEILEKVNQSAVSKDEKNTGSIKIVLASLLANVAEDVFKESVMPIMKTHLATLSNKLKSPISSNASH